jgi:hypothetical protein
MHLDMSRRTFVKSAAAAAGAAYLMPAASFARMRGASERLVFGVIGTGGQGNVPRQSARRASGQGQHRG